jgi:murein DD-endopeptidase MepM/ murein hydrolase activator NlpD
MVPDLEWKSITVARGDSLAKIFKQENIDGAQLQKVLDSGDIAKKLTRIHPGQIIQLQIDPEASRLVRLRYDLDRLNRLEVRATDDRFESELVVEIPDLHRTTKTAEIESSLFLAGNEAGLPDRIIMELAEIFGWDIDFALDIRTGDKFAVLYEERYLDGEMIDTGRILAAEFVNQGKTYKAVRFVDDEGNADYYTPEGRSMRREFIRTPVAFSRISSKFSLGRKHPILNRIRAHKGVDYAAPTGTPIKATGNGKIVFRGTKGGYGRAVVIQHGTRYSTLYGHMSKFKGGLKVGSRVRQGDVIGYVGMSGLATGPHLHYEFLVNGVHRNPLTVKLPKANPLPKRYLTEFQQVSETNLALLESAKTEAVAALDR